MREKALVEILETLLPTSVDNNMLRRSNSHLPSHSFCNADDMKMLTLPMRLLMRRHLMRLLPRVAPLRLSTIVLCDDS